MKVLQELRKNIFLPIGLRSFPALYFDLHGLRGREKRKRLKGEGSDSAFAIRCVVFLRDRVPASNFKIDIPHRDMERDPFIPISQEDDLLDRPESVIRLEGKVAYGKPDFYDLPRLLIP